MQTRRERAHHVLRGEAQHKADGGQVTKSPAYRTRLGKTAAARPVQGEGLSSKVRLDKGKITSL